MNEPLSIVVLQLQSVDDTQKNLEQILDLLSLRQKSNTRSLICLPENSVFMRLEEGAKIQGLTLEDPVFGALLNRSKELGATFHLGSVPLKMGNKLGNVSVLIDPEHGIRPAYQKVHLFDIALEGQAPMRESDVFHPGDEESSFDLGNWKIGQSICYDLRFSELYLRYAKAGCSLVLIPAAFLKTTGEMHWHVLVRARAIESQCYVVAAAQAGVHKSIRGQRETYGHSLIVDPWGRVIAEGSGDSPQLIEATLDLALVRRVRTQIPMASHRKLY